MEDDKNEDEEGNKNAEDEGLKIDELAVEKIAGEIHFEEQEEEGPAPCWEDRIEDEETDEEDRNEGETEDDERREADEEEDKEEEDD